MLVILSTHPIQYQVPLWQELARDGRIPFEVWYLTRQATDISHDREFGTAFAWDLDMLSGYPHRFLDVAPGATPNSFWKCRLREQLAKRMLGAKGKAVWIQGWQVAAYWQAVWAAKKVGAEVWLRGESNDLAPTPFWKRALKRITLGQLFRRVDRFLYIGKANRRLYQKFGVPEDRLYPAPYAVDNERFARQAESIRNSKSSASAQGYGVTGRSASGPASSSESTPARREGPTLRPVSPTSWKRPRREIRGQWKIPEDAFCVLFCGKFIPKKRPLDLVKAAQLLSTDPPKDGFASPSCSALPLGCIALRAGSRAGSVANNQPPNIHLLFVGSGELGGALRAHSNVVFDGEQGAGSTEQRARKTDLTSGMKPRASFAGFLNQTEISKAYVAADCLVLPSDYGETWGLVVNEAMASGLPCLISDQCGCAEDLRSLGSNEIFSCGDVCELAERLRAVAQLKTENPIMLSQLPTFAETVSTVGLLYSALSFGSREIGR